MFEKISETVVLKLLISKRIKRCVLGIDNIPDVIRTECLMIGSILRYSGKTKIQEMGPGRPNYCYVL